MDPVSTAARRFSLEQAAVAGAISALTAAIVVPVAAHINVWIGALTAILCFLPVGWMAHRVPETLTGAQRRRPVLSVLWCVLVLVAVIQMARLSAFMVDSSRLWGSTVPDPVAADHQCLAAYVHAEWRIAGPMDRRSRGRCRGLAYPGHLRIDPDDAEFPVRPVSRDGRYAGSRRDGCV
jgi:hypothetical protein